MPRGKLIDRSDFKFYGLDHDARIRAWRLAPGDGRGRAAARRIRGVRGQAGRRPDPSALSDADRPPKHEKDRS